MGRDEPVEEIDPQEDEELAAALFGEWTDSRWA